jgi:hypothetical protein
MVFYDTGDLTQGLLCARQALELCPSHFFLFLFLRKDLIITFDQAGLELQIFLPSLLE